VTEAVGNQFQIEEIAGAGFPLKASIEQRSGSSPTVLCLGGLLSDQLAVEGSRAQALSDLCQQYGMSFVRFNYRAHGFSPSTRSSGEFHDVTIAGLIDDTVAVAGWSEARSVVLVGSSIGAGIMPFVAKQLKETGTEVVGFYGVSAVPPIALRDFVLSQISRNGLLAEFQRDGEVVVTSDTLPFPVSVQQAQFDNIVDYARALPVLADEGLPLGLLHGHFDTLSTQAINRELAILFGQPGVEIVEVDEGHEISFETMTAFLSSRLSQFVS